MDTAVLVPFRVLPMEDLIREGSIALMNAADKFNTARNCRFITYAAWFVRAEMMGAI
jgi:DNA-directed RNA polymerase sigma subunit (sigma70/sigma32)